MKTVAVVVTRNRLEDLKRCVHALTVQSFPLESIVVVDNDSSDGTIEWLGTQKKVNVIKQANTGSAGGQYTGIQAAYNSGADLIYAMDDDCIPASDAVKSLVEARKKVSPVEDWVLTSFVVDKTSGHCGPLGDTEPGLPNPPTRLYYSLPEIPPEKMHNGIFENWGHFFLGVMLPRAVIEKVGLPDPKYFIRGEDYEYMLRCLRSVRVGCVLSSRMHHGMPGKILECPKVYDYKLYCQLRNNLFINRHYFPSWRNGIFFRTAKYFKLLIQDARCGIWFDKMKLLAFWDASRAYFNRQPEK